MTYDALVPAELAAMLTLYKVTGPNGEPLHGGSGAWPLPTADAPGEWWDVAGEVQGCRTGLHLTDREHLMSWVPNVGDPIVWRAEVRGPLYRVDYGDKYVCGSARLLPRTRKSGADPAVLGRRRDAAIARAERRKVRADRMLRRTLGDGWATMARRIGGRLWPDVPARVREAIQVWTAERNAADAASADAVRKYSAAIGRAILPD